MDISGAGTMSVHYPLVDTLLCVRIRSIPRSQPLSLLRRINTLPGLACLSGHIGRAEMSPRRKHVRVAPER